MSRPPSLRALPWLAVGGLLAGHAVTGWIVGGHAARPDLHGYLAQAGRLGAVTAVVSLTALVTGRIARRERDAPSATSVFGTLATLQVIAFTLMEITERVAAGAHLGDLAWTLPLGCVVQVVAALALAVTVRWLLRTSDRAIARAARPGPRPRDRASWSILPPHALLALMHRTAGAARAPPI